jgi:hypothetical protein
VSGSIAALSRCTELQVVLLSRTRKKDELYVFFFHLWIIPIIPYSYATVFKNGLIDLIVIFALAQSCLNQVLSATWMLLNIAQTCAIVSSTTVACLAQLRCVRKLI